MWGEGFAVGWILRRESSHVVGVRVELKVKEQGQVVLDHIPQKQILIRAVLHGCYPGNGVTAERECAILCASSGESMEVATCGSSWLVAALLASVHAPPESQLGITRDGGHREFENIGHVVRSGCHDPGSASR